MAHGLLDQIGGFHQKRLIGAAIHRFLADLQHDRHRQRRYLLKMLMHDSTTHAREHLGKSADIEQPGRRIGARCLQQDMVRLVAAQHVIDEIGRHRHLTAALLLSRKTLLDQPCDDSAGAESTLQHPAVVQPGLEIVAQHVFVEQGGQ